MGLKQLYALKKPECDCIKVDELDGDKDAGLMPVFVTRASAEAHTAGTNLTVVKIEVSEIQE